MHKCWKLRLSLRYNSGTSCRMNWGGGGKQAAKSDYYGLLQERRSEGTNWGRRNRKGEGDIGKGRAHEWSSRRADNNIYYRDRMQASKIRSYLIKIAREKRFKNTAESFQKNVCDKEAISGRFILISSGIQRISLRSSPRHLRREFRFVISFVTAWGSPWPRHLDRSSKGTLSANSSSLIPSPPTLSIIQVMGVGACEITCGQRKIGGFLLFFQQKQARERYNGFTHVEQC